MQHCPRCDRDLPLDAYYPDKRGKRGHYCRHCTREYHREWRRARGIQPQKQKQQRICAQPGCSKPPSTKSGKYCSREHWAPRRERELSTTYRAVHRRVQRQRGHANQHDCAHCGQQADQWAYDHEDPAEMSTEWYGKTVAYSAEVDHYLPLCRGCHARFDARGREVAPAVPAPEPRMRTHTLW